MPRYIGVIHYRFTHLRSMCNARPMHLTLTHVKPMLSYVTIVQHLSSILFSSPRTSYFSIVASKFHPSRDSFTPSHLLHRSCAWPRTAPIVTKLPVRNFAKFKDNSRLLLKFERKRESGKRDRAMFLLIYFFFFVYPLSLVAFSVGV